MSAPPHSVAGGGVLVRRLHLRDLDVEVSDLDDFGAREASEAGLVHVCFAADRRQWRSLLVAMRSTVRSVQDRKQRDRLRLHVFADGIDEMRDLLEYLASRANEGTLLDVRLHSDVGVQPSAAALRLTAMSSSIVRVGSFLDVHLFDAKSVIHMQIRSSHLDNDEARQLSTPHNYVRFYLPTLLPHVDKALWLDSDVIVQDNVVNLFDSTLNDGAERADELLGDADTCKIAPPAAVVVKWRAYKSSIIRRIVAGLEGRPFGVHPHNRVKGAEKSAAEADDDDDNDDKGVGDGKDGRRRRRRKNAGDAVDSSDIGDNDDDDDERSDRDAEKRPRSLHVSDEVAPLLDELKRRAAPCIASGTKIGNGARQSECFHFNAGVLLMRLDRWRRYNVTERIARWVDFLSHNPALALGLTQPPLTLAFYDCVEALDERWNTGSAKDLHEMAERGDTEALRRAAILHFNGDAKPWLSANPVIRSIWERYN